AESPWIEAGQLGIRQLDVARSLCRADKRNRAQTSRLAFQTQIKQPGNRRPRRPGEQCGGIRARERHFHMRIQATPYITECSGASELPPRHFTSAVQRDAVVTETHRPTQVASVDVWQQPHAPDFECNLPGKPAEQSGAERLARPGPAW